MCVSIFRGTDTTKTSYIADFELGTVSITVSEYVVVSRFFHVVGQLNKFVDGGDGDGLELWAV